MDRSVFTQSGTDRTLLIYQGTEMSVLIQSHIVNTLQDPPKSVQNFNTLYRYVGVVATALYGNVWVCIGVYGYLVV